MRAVAERLWADGVRVWLDDWEIRPGDSIPVKIEAALEHSRVQNLKAIQEGYDYFVKQLEPVPYPSVVAMQAVVDQIAESNPKARGIDAKSYVSDRYLKRLEEEGFVKKIWGE